MITREVAEPYLGHEDELDLLSEMLGHAAGGRGRLVVLRGPSGIGTTATARQARSRAAEQGFGALWGACREGLAGRPFEALAEALDGYAAQVTPAALYEEVGDGASALARLAPAIRTRLPAIPPPAPLDPSAERLRVCRAVLDWLERATAERPLLIVLDDLQWADADLRLLLDGLADHLGRLAVLLLATWADQPGNHAGEAQTEPEPPPYARQIELGGLDEGATGAFLTRHADRPISGAALGLIQDVSGGHPLAALELYRHLRTEGLIGRPGGDRLPAADALPRDVEELVAWRVAALSLEERTALGALACFPQPASAGQLATVSGLSRARSGDALEKCVGGGFVASPEMSGSYAIVHPRVQLAIRAGLSPAVCGEALARVAQALEAELGAEARQQAPMLAELYRQALASAPGAVGDGGARSAAGIRFALVAAEQARAASAFRRAADCVALAAALATAGGSADRAELRVRLAVARAEADQPAEALELAREAIANGRRDDLDQLVAVIRALLDHGRTEQAEELRGAAARSSGSLPPLVAARLDLLGGRWQPVGQGSVRLLVWQTDEDEAERLLLRDGDEQDLSELFAAPRPRGREQTVKLLNLARGWRRPSALLRALHGATVDLATRLGAYKEASSWAGEYLAAAERYGSPVDHIRAALLLAQCNAMLGDFASAEESLAAAGVGIERLPPAERPLAEQLAAELALAHYRDGDWAALGARAADLTAEPTPHGLLLTAERSLAAARLGDRSLAGGLLDDVLEVAAAWPPLTYLRDSALLVGLTVAWECGWAQHAVRGRALVALSAAAGIGGNHAATLELASARLHALGGQLDEARAVFAAQRAALEEAGLRPLRAILDHDEAIAIAAAGESGYAEAVALLGAAARAFEELGMTGWHGRSTRLIERGLDAAAAPGGRLQITYPLGLSRREADIVRLVSGGASPDEAAAELDLEAGVASRHLASAMAKIGANELSELPRLARRHGLGGGV
jgi:DNA-binding CsgD family transcriptional regulator